MARTLKPKARPVVKHRTATATRTQQPKTSQAQRAEAEAARLKALALQAEAEAARLKALVIQAEEAERRRKELEDEESDEEGETGQQGESGSSGGGVDFDQNDNDFDATELQGMSLPIFRKALKKGLKLVSRITKQSENYLRNFMPDPKLRSRVIEVALSERGHPTLLLDKGEIVQYQLSQGKLDRVRVSSDLDAEQAVKYAMAGFLAAGESIDPKHVKFGRSPEFQARMMPIWTREWQKMQADDTAMRHDLHLDNPRKDASFQKSVAAQVSTKSILARTQTPKQKPQNKLADIPHPTRFRNYEPRL